LKPSGTAAVPPLELRPEALRERHQRLTEQKKSRGLAPAELEALAECCFRLAVHPATPVDEAVRLLHRAIRMDRANPKYGYHLARVYFLHGELERCSKWLEAAARLCPTSHRVWAHVCLLQRELNRRYRGDERYEQDGLRRRSDKLAARIQQGEDAAEPELLDLKPPRSLAAVEAERRRGLGAAAREATGAGDGRPSAVGAVRFTGNGNCRWTGIHDLLAEDLLEAAPSTRNRDRLLQLWERILEAAQRRRGGYAGFAVLAVEWLLAGYPPASVRRLAARLPGPPQPAAGELVELACTAFELPAADVSGLLARALEEDRFPPLLAAAIHQRRLLRHPLEFPTLALHFRAAEKLLESARARTGAEVRRQLLAEAAAALKNLRRAAHELDPPETDEVADVSAGKATAEEPQDPAERIRGMDAFLREAKERVDAGWGRLQQITEAHAQKKASADELREAHELGAVAASVAEQAAEKVTALRILRDSGAVTRAELLAEMNRVQEGLQNLAGTQGRFRRKLMRLPGAPEAPAPATKPAEKAAADPAAPPAAPAAAASAEKSSADPLAQLAGLLAETERRVAELFAAAGASFRPYSARAVQMGPLRELRRYVEAREAEAWYRLGRRARARRIWVRLLCEDRLNEALLKCVAVCDTIEGDPARHLSSWRAYAEMLYFHAVAAGTPRVGALARADFHRHFGRAYGPAFLAEEKEGPGEFDENAWLGFFNSPVRARLFVEHTLLEFFNARLDFTSPPLLLGIQSKEGARREEARKEMRSFLEGVAAGIPGKVRTPFGELAQETLEEADRACQSPARLTQRRDTQYDEERKRLLEWIGKVLDLKYRITAAVHRDEGKWMEEAENVEAALHLARLNRIPIRSSPELLENAARARRFSGQVVDSIEKALEQLPEAVAGHLVTRVFLGNSEDDASDARRLELYRRMVRDWPGEPALTKWLAVIDDPGCLKGFFPEAMNEAIRKGRADAQMTASLRELWKRYPASTGIARRLALLLANDKNFCEAFKLLEAARGAALSDDARRECDDIRRQLRVLQVNADLEAGEFDRALPALLEILAEDDHQPGLPRLVMQALQGMAMKTKRTEGCDAAAAAVRAWVGRARARLAAGHADAEKPATELTEDAVAAVENELPEAILGCYVAAAGGIQGEKTDWEALERQMTRLLAGDAKPAKAYFLRMMARWRLAVKASAERDAGRVRSMAREAGEDARKVLKLSTDAEEKSQAEQLLEQVKSLGE
jgi:hypothetical protein